MNYLNAPYMLTNINKPLKRKHAFDSCSLLDSLPDLFKFFPRNFVITTNNGKYYFNKELICISIPIINGAIKNDKDLAQFHFNIDDNLNVMKKIESLFKGEPIDFLASEEKEVKKITKLFKNQFFLITISSQNGTLPKELQEKLSVKINLELLFQLLQEKQANTFKINTKKNEYLCSSLGIFTSNVISEFLTSNPNSTSFDFNFSDEDSEFKLISDYFNFKEMKISSENIESIQLIAEQLEITPIIKLVNETYDKYDENIQKSTENQSEIDPYDELFENLFNIQRIGIEKVAELILESDWVKSESDIKELVACFIHVINSDIFIHHEILDLIILLSESQDKSPDLSILIPFLTNKILKIFTKSKFYASFMYCLYRKNIVPIDLIIKQISLNFQANRQYMVGRIIDSFLFTGPNNNNLYSLILFYPELVERNLLDDKFQSMLQPKIYYINSNITTVEQMKQSRDNYVEKDSILEALKKDDVDTFQSIISTGEIDIQKKKIELPFINNFENRISFIDYAAACGSTKCFKYLYLNDASFNYNTFVCAVYGANVEIIRIVDQNKSNFSSGNNFNNDNINYRLYMPEYVGRSPMINVIETAIKRHEYNIFDWLLDQNYYESENDLIVLLKTSISSGNAHSMTEIIRKFSNLNKLENKELYLIIEEACNHGFYKILKFLTHLIQFHDLTDPTKGDHSDVNDISNRRLKIRYLNSDLLKSAVSYGMFSIFELILNETDITNSQCLFECLLEAVKSNNLEVVKYILDSSKLYQLSPVLLTKAIMQSIKCDSEDVTNYFFEKEKEITVSTEILESACAAQNFKLVKLLVQKAAEKQVSLDFTDPFIKAVNPFSEEICRYFIEMKVTFNYQKIFGQFNSILNNNPKMIILLIENADNEIKDDIVSQSLRAAISSRDTEILDFLFKQEINLNGLLIQAIENSEIETVKVILNYNKTPEFINQIGPNGTALHVAIYEFKNIIVKYLLELPGIDPSISIDSKTTPLVEAVESNNLDAVVSILDFYGDSIKDQGHQIQNAFDHILSKQSNRFTLNRLTNNNRNRRRNYADIINDNLNNNNDNFNNNRQIFGYNRGNVKVELRIFELLLDVKKKYNLTNNNGNDQDLLLYAILQNDPEIVQKVLSIESTDINRRLANGNTYLLIAIEGPEITPIQKALIEYPGININAQNASSETALIKAVKCENVELVKLILAHPKFDPNLSLLDYAFYLSVSSKALSRILLKEKSLDVNYRFIRPDQNQGQYLNQDLNQQLITTSLMEAIRFNDIELAELIIHHHSFNPSKSKIKACLFNSISCKDLNLFRFLLKMNGNEINIKDNRNISLLGRAASIKDNNEILNEILNNENFDPVKSDIQTSFLESNDIKAMKILIAYDEKHGNCLTFDKIDSRVQLNLEPRNRNLNVAPIISHQFLLRRKGIVPKIRPFCTFAVAKNKIASQPLYRCETCQIPEICEVCARICHKGHQIEKMKINNYTSNEYLCSCSLREHHCKCMPIENSNDDEIDDEIIESMSLSVDEKGQIDNFYYNNMNPNPLGFINNNMYNNNFHNDDVASDDADDDFDADGDDIADDNDRGFDGLRCSLDLARFQPILQIMYRCNKCQVDICQNCAIKCHKGHSLSYKGLVPNSLCNCKNITDCKITDRKEVICNYLFYGTEYVTQPWFKCETCGTNGNRGCCALCSKHCHKGHKIHSEGEENAFCDCGANDLKTICHCMKFPPFNYLTCCTNRNQFYEVQMQRMYHCFTCGITSKNNGICESCAIHCHVGHNVAFIGVRSFACECATVNINVRKFNCIASLCPEMNYTGKCANLNHNKDAVFGKYVCLTCDKEGKKDICESCAVKCHKSHDVHFVEFSNFKCQCEPCKCLENEH